MAETEPKKMTDVEAEALPKTEAAKPQVTTAASSKGSKLQHVIEYDEILTATGMNCQL